MRILLLAAMVLLLVPTPSPGSQVVPEAVLVRTSPNSSIKSVNTRYSSQVLGRLGESDLYLLSVPSQETAPSFLFTLSTDPDVQIAEANVQTATPEGLRAMVISGTGGGFSEFEDQEALSRVGARSVYLPGLGSGVTVAILDSGIDLDHDLFAGRIHSAGTDFVDFDGIPEDTADGADNDGDGFVDEGYGHGTMVAGIVSALAPDCTILPIRVLNDEAQGDAFTLTQGIAYAVEQGADIINLSLGSTIEIDAVEEEIYAAAAAGVVVVASAGNRDLREPPLFPASESQALMITALDENNVKAVFADYHSDVDLAAPGVGIRSAFPGNAWAIGDGCSFATPFVTGAAAALLSREPGLSREDVVERLHLGTKPLENIPGNLPYQGEIGRGLLSLPLVLSSSTSAVSPEVDPALLFRAFPNPSHGWVSFVRDSEDAAFEVQIFDALGRLIREGQDLSLGWDGRNQAGVTVPRGMYFARFKSPKGEVIQSLRLLRP